MATANSYHAAIGAHPCSLAGRGPAQPLCCPAFAAALGYQETINFSFVEESWERDLAGNVQPIKLLNPIASQMGVMRSSLMGSLLQVLKFNLDRKASRVRVFEIGRVFRRDPAVPTADSTVRGVSQPMRVAGLAYGSVDGLQWARKGEAADFFDAKGMLRHCWRRSAPNSGLPSIQHCIRVAAPVSGWATRRLALWVNCIRGLAAAWDLAETPMLFELTSRRCARRVPEFCVRAAFPAC